MHLKSELNIKVKLDIASGCHVPTKDRPHLINGPPYQSVLLIRRSRLLDSRRRNSDQCSSKTDNLSSILLKLSANLIPLLVKQRIRGYIFTNNAIGGDDRIIANGYTFKHHNIRAQPHIVTNTDGSSRSRLVPIQDSILRHTVVEVIHVDVWTK